MNTQLAERKFRTLPDDLKKEVLNFMEFLLVKRKKEKTLRSSKFDFSWEGGLSDLKEKYNSVELQHQSMSWRQGVYLVSSMPSRENFIGQ